MLPAVPAHAPAFVKDVLGMMIANRGDDLPVSAMPCDGTFPTGTTQYEKRSIAQDIPIWDPKICIQCGLCSLGCPHASIRMKAVDPALLAGAPRGFKSADYKGKEFPAGSSSSRSPPTIAPAAACASSVCPAKDKEKVKHKAIDMEPLLQHHAAEQANFEYFLTLPDVDRTTVKADTIKGSQLLQPLFEFSGACAGCGETPYIKLLTQFFGDRMLIGNATGCSSIYGGNLPCTPYSPEPRRPRAVLVELAVRGLRRVRPGLPPGRRSAGGLCQGTARAAVLAVGRRAGRRHCSNNKQETEAELAAQRADVAELNKRLAAIGNADAKDLLASSDYLIRKSVWSFGGDGWAYDIGFGGLDHVFALGRDVNILVLDTEVYSNTGGQASKSTFRGAVAKFAAGGKPGRKKDLGMIAMSYGNVFVGSISLGANPMHAIRTIRAAESYRGTSLLIAFSHCINWGINMMQGMEIQKHAVACGYWPLYSFDPRDEAHPFKLASKKPEGAFKDFALKEARFGILARSKPEESARLLELGQQDIDGRYQFYEQLAGVDRTVAAETAAAAAAGNGNS